MWLFLSVPWNGQQCVIVVFPDHTHLLFCEIYAILMTKKIIDRAKNRAKNRNNEQHLIQVQCPNFKIIWHNNSS